MKWIALLLLLNLTTACGSQANKRTEQKTPRSSKLLGQIPIGNYVTGTYEDSKGQLWFGTLEKGIARYDGSALKYFTTADGLPSNRVTSITEDSNGHYWFNTGEGLCKFDGSTYEQFIIKERDFASNMISQFYIDSKGQFWIGTWAGVFQFDGSHFTPFPLPYPEVSTAINEDTKNWITEIKEDAMGNMWFGRDGYGICVYDGASFRHYLKKDGLHSNYVTEIVINDKNDIWIGTRVAEKDHPDPSQRKGPGGVNRLVNGQMLSIPDIAGFNTNDVFEIHKDQNGNIWIATVRDGLYKYDGRSFEQYEIPISGMSITDDQNGKIWLGGAGGLYRIDPDGEIVHVTIQGPWD